MNGSPPPARSRRGWMSDSPLDGGTGWPTSAYAIVPRQPAAPQAERLPRAAGPHEAAPAEPEERPRRGRIITLVIVGVVVLAIAIAGGVLATRDTSSSRSGTPAAVTTPTPDDPTAAATDPSADASPSGSASGSTNPSAGGSALPTPSGSLAPPGAIVVESPIPAGATDVLRVGTVRLSALLGQPGETFDLDTGTATPTGADVTAAAVGLNAGAGAMLGVWTAPEPPTLAGCSGTTVQWSKQVLLAALVPGARVCVQTTEGRYGWFTPRGGDVIVSGALYTTYLDFTVYKKTGD